MTKIAASPAAVLAGLIVFAGAIRFSTLDLQSFNEDELFTRWLVRMPFRDMLDEVSRTESTPYLYYVVAWAWSKVFGAGEVGLRSLSTVLGTLTVPVVWLAARDLASRRVALTAGVLVAANPMLVWFSQEARSYALLVLLCSLSLLLVVRALAGDELRVYLLWALTAGAALATHYFAIFLVVPETAWLLARARPRRLALLAGVLPAAVAGALVPLALSQRSHGNTETVSAAASLGIRVAQIPKNYLVGFSSPIEVPAAFAAATLVLVAIYLGGFRLERVERRKVALPALMGAVAVGVPVVLALAGADYVASRNVVGFLPLFAIPIAAGFAARRLGLIAATCLCVLSLGVIAAVEADPHSQRTDWRGAAHSLGPRIRPRAIVVTPGVIDSRVWTYVGTTHDAGRTVRVSEVDVVGLATVGTYGWGTPRPPRPTVLRRPQGFMLTDLRETATHTLLRFVARSPLRLTRSSLAKLALGRNQAPVVLLQP